MLTGDEIQRIVETYSDTLLRVALHNTQNQSDAEDVVQTVFLKLLRLAPAFQSAEHEKAWLIRVTVNQCRDLMRSAFKKRSVSLEEWQGKTDLSADIRAGEVVEAVRALPEKYSMPVFLYYYEGYSTAEIAQILALRQGTVESRLHRARAKLASLLEGEWD